MPVRILALNQSAVASLDQPWIERNGFYGGASRDFGRHLARLLEYLEDDPRWDELRLGGLLRAHADEVQHAAARTGLGCRIEIDQPSFSVDLRRVREEFNGAYLSALSANTRQQIKRAHRQSERTLGTIRLEQASTVEMAMTWLDATGSLHRRRWGERNDTPYASGFVNPRFVDFHRRLIQLAFPTGGIQYLRLSAGDSTLAYLYNFVSGSKVHFYLSGIDYDIDSSIKPGMLAHWLAIEKNLSVGMDEYDFLAGDARYKRSLSTSSDRTQWFVLQRPRWRLRCEAFARSLKKRFLARSGS